MLIERFKSFLRIKKNLVWILILNITSILIQFIVYRIIFKQLGDEQMGIWSLISASASLGMISNFGFGSGLIKFTAEAIANDHKQEINQYAGTANISNIFFSLPFVISCYYLSIVFAEPVLTSIQFHHFKYVLQFSMLAIYLNNVSSTYLSLLDGYQKFSERCIIQIIGFFVFGTAVVLLLKKHNLAAVSYSLCLQSIVVLTASLYIVCKRKIVFSFFPLQFEITIFKKLVAYGLKFQMINILVFLFEPISKFFITRYSGLETVAIYELATKLVIQARTLVVNLLQVMVPQVASKKIVKEKEEYIINKIRFNTFLSINMMISMLFVIPVASFFFIGSISTNFIICCSLLLFGWLFNMLVAPVYFACLGLEKLNIIIINHLITSLVTVGLYLFFGKSPYNLILFSIPSLSLIAGSIYLILRFSVVCSAPILQIFKKEKLLLVYFFISAFSLIFFAIFLKTSLVFLFASILFFWLLLLYNFFRFSNIFQNNRY